MITFNITQSALDEFNKTSFHYRLPALIFLGFMLPFGIVGNASVIYIYGFRLKKSNIHLFIALLAVSDTISCLAGIPMEIYRMCFFHNYPSVAACKTEGFFTFACYICSMLMLLTISVERYVKVCRSTKTQVSRKVAKILAGIVFLVSSLLAIPLPVFAAPFPYILDNGVVVHNCTYHIETELWYYCIIFFVVLIGVLVAMFVLYWKVLKTAHQHVTWTLQRKARSSNDAIDATQAAKPAVDKRLSQTNRTVIWISVVYAASCVPIFTIAMVTKLFTHLKAPNSLDFLLFVLYQSWILNCTLNPVVYGFLNGKFRDEFHNVLSLIFTRANILNVNSTEKSTESTLTGSAATI